MEILKTQNILLSLSKKDWGTRLCLLVIELHQQQQPPAGVVAVGFPHPTLEKQADNGLNL